MLKIIKTSDYKKDLTNICKFYNSNLKIESIIARNELFLENIIVKKDNFWKPIFDKNKYYCISHKENLVFVWSSDFPIWIDIEYFKQRNIEILNYHSDLEYNLIWEKNLENFYIFWTIKESIIKLFNTNLDDLENIKIKNITKSKNKIDEIYFNLKAISKFNNKKIITYSWIIEKNIIYSYSFFLD